SAFSEGFASDESVRELSSVWPQPDRSSIKDRTPDKRITLRLFLYMCHIFPITLPPDFLSFCKYTAKPLIISFYPAPFCSETMGHSFQHMGFYRYSCFFQSLDTFFKFPYKRIPGSVCKIGRRKIP